MWRSNHSKVSEIEWIFHIDKNNFRKEWRDKVTGGAGYTGDFEKQGLVHVLREQLGLFNASTAPPILS